MKAYKITDKDGRCFDQKYTVGKTYKYNGSLAMCTSGYHACRKPMDCQNYREIADGRFFEVEMGGEIIHGDDKSACSEMKIVKELTLKEYINACFESIYEEPKDYSQLAASGDYSQLAASGDYSIAASIGYEGKAKVDHKTSWLVISDFDEKGRVKRVVAKKPGQKCDGIKIKTGYWYWFKNGKLKSEKG